jgi:Zn-dependent protease with chaperone function
MSQEKVNERASQEGDVEKLEELRQRTARIHQLYEKRYGTTLPLIYSFKISNSPNGVASCNFSIIERNFFPNRVTRILSNKCTIVVNDEFFNLPDADKDAILAHEIGHRISAYAPKNLYRFEWYCLINRVISHEKIDGIPLLLIIPQLYRNYCARQLEFEADRQAVLAIGSIAGLKSHLSIHKDVELGWFILLFLTHPTEKDRISALEKIEREELPEQKQQVQEDIQKQHYPQEEVD